MHELTIENHEAAKFRLAATHQRWEYYNCNNPDKYRSRLREASKVLAAIEVDFKRLQELVFIEDERLYAKLDQAFPNARSGEVVVFKEVRYRPRFYPAARSNSSKSVRIWVETWERLPDTCGIGAAPT